MKCLGQCFVEEFVSVSRDPLLSVMLFCHSRQNSDSRTVNRSNASSVSIMRFNNLSIEDNHRSLVEIFPLTPLEAENLDEEETRLTAIKSSLNDKYILRKLSVRLWL